MPTGHVLGEVPRSDFPAKRVRGPIRRPDVGLGFNNFAGEQALAEFSDEKFPQQTLGYGERGSDEE